jgi:predicted lipid-binding transport protein (Tim44 family)
MTADQTLTAEREADYLRGYRDALAHAAFYVRDHCQHGDEHAEAVFSLKVPAAQPADSAMEDEQIEAMAHRMAWRYKHSSDPAHSHTYTFNRARLLEFARALTRHPPNHG